MSNTSRLIRAYIHEGRVQFYENRNSHIGVSCGVLIETHPATWAFFPDRFLELSRAIMQEITNKLIALEATSAADLERETSENEDL